MDKKIAVLTGGTSGIGMQTALALKSAGYTVYELSRRAQGVEGLNHLVADVTDEAAVKKAVDEIVAREGKIDVLVNNAGFGISGAVEFIPFQTYYSAAKAATNSYTMALANELRPYGITVCAVQPGDIKTGFTKAREKTVDGDDVYGGRIGRSVSRMEHDEQTGMDPAVAGKFIANVAMKKKVSPIYTIGASYSFLTFLTRLMSWKTMNSIIGAIYAK